MGKEGPMIHSGAVVGAGLPQVKVGGPGYASLRMGLLGKLSRVRFQNLLPFGVEVKTVWPIPAKYLFLFKV